MAMVVMRSVISAHTPVSVDRVSAVISASASTKLTVSPAWKVPTLTLVSEAAGLNRSRQLPLQRAGHWPLLP
jgi:hypothetical protein